MPLVCVASFVGRSTKSSPFFVTLMLLSVFLSLVGTAEQKAVDAGNDSTGSCVGRGCSAMAVKDEDEVELTKERMVDLVRHFYSMGFMRDQGGGIAVRVPSQDLILCSPTSVQKEQWNERDIFVWSESRKEFLSRPESPNKVPSSPLGLVQATGANTVIHTHSKFAVLLTKLIPGNEFVISDQEMLVGIPNRANRDGNGRMCNFQNVDEIIVPIVEAKPTEVELGPPIREALAKYPTTSAVLVRGHGVFHFGFGISWQRTKMMMECYEYLFEMGCMMINSGIPLTTHRTPPRTMVPLQPNYREHLRRKSSPPKPEDNE